MFEKRHVAKSREIWEVALIGPREAPTAVRVAIPNRSVAKPITDADAVELDLIEEKILTALRLAFDPDLYFFNTGHAGPDAIYNYIPAGNSPDLSIEISLKRAMDVPVAAAAFEQDGSTMITLKLLTDARAPRLPLPYRYLSYYKILENSFKRRRYWEAEFQKHLICFGDEFEKLNISNMKIDKFIISMRDRCAHVKIGEDEELGILGRSSPLGRKLAAFFPLFSRIAESHIDVNFQLTGVPIRLVSPEL